VQDTAAELDRRYGRTRGNSRRTRVIIIATAVAFAAVLVAWLVWGGLLSANADIEAVDTGHTIVDDTLVQVRYQLTVEPGSTVTCAFQAQNSTFAIVGWNIVDVPASERRTRTLGAEIRTTELAVTGLIYRCWLT
jgi:ammonia channel protein AmtB